MTPTVYGDVPLGVECAWTGSTAVTPRARSNRRAALILAAFVFATAGGYLARRYVIDAGVAVAQWLGFGAG